MKKALIESISYIRKATNEKITINVAVDPEYDERIIKASKNINNNKMKIKLINYWNKNSTEITILNFGYKISLSSETKNYKGQKLYFVVLLNFGLFIYP